MAASSASPLGMSAATRAMLRFRPDFRMPSICHEQPGWVQRSIIVSSPVDLSLDGVAWRYFSAIPGRPGCSGADCVRLLFKDAVTESFIGTVASRDGVHFDPAVTAVLNSSWPHAHMTHNTAIVTSPSPWHGPPRKEYLLVGGQHNREPVKPGERPNDGVWLTRWRADMPTAGSLAAQFLFNGSHPGCVERRIEAEGKWLYPGTHRSSRACGFDGRLSLVFHAGRWLLYARANPTVRGHRFVQVVRSLTDRLDGPWESFRQIRFRAYPPDVAGGGPDIYYFLVQNNPALPGTLIATFPFYHLRMGCTAIACSFDGVHWSPPISLVPCGVVDRATGRTLCHPTNLLHKGGKEALLYTQDSVPIDDFRKRRGQPPAQLVQHRIPMELLSRMSNRALASISSRFRSKPMRLTHRAGKNKR